MLPWDYLTFGRHKYRIAAISGPSYRLACTAAFLCYPIERLSLLAGDQNGSVHVCGVLEQMLYTWESKLDPIHLCLLDTHAEREGAHPATKNINTIATITSLMFFLRFRQQLKYITSFYVRGFVPPWLYWPIGSDKNRISTIPNPGYVIPLASAFINNLIKRPLIIYRRPIWVATSSCAVLVKVGIELSTYPEVHSIFPIGTGRCAAN